MWRVEPGSETHDTSASEPTLRAGKPRSETGCSVVGQSLSAFGWHFQETVTAVDRMRWPWLLNRTRLVADQNQTRAMSVTLRRFVVLRCSKFSGRASAGEPTVRRRPA